MTKVIGDIFEVERGIIVHGCNARGRMGGGIALQIKEHFPEAYEVYRATYNRHGLFLGDITTVKVGPQLWVVNAITQENYGYADRTVYADYDAIRECFSKVANLARKHKLPVIYPRIGAGLANGDWAKIQQIIDEELANFEHYYYELPKGDPRWT